MGASLRSRRILALLAFGSLAVLVGIVEQRVLIPFAESKDPDAAVIYWEEHVERNPETAASHLRLGLAYTKAGQLEEAKSSFGNALAIDATYDAAAIGAYGVATQLGKREHALAELERYVSGSPNCGVCWQNLAAEYLRLKNLRAAQDAVGKLLASDLSVDSAMYSAGSMEVEALVLAGRVSAARGDRARAIEFFRNAIVRDPDDLRAYLLQAKNLLAGERPGQALAVLDAADSRANESPRIQREIDRLQRRARQIQQ